MKRILMITVAVVALSGCAGEAPHQALLDAAEAKCRTETQPRIECTTYVPQLRVIVAQERAEQQNMAAAAVAAALLGVAAVALDASDDCCYYHPYHHWRR